MLGADAVTVTDTDTGTGCGHRGQKRQPAATAEHSRVLIPDPHGPRHASGRGRRTGGGQDTAVHAPRARAPPVGRRRGPQPDRNSWPHLVGGPGPGCLLRPRPRVDRPCRFLWSIRRSEPCEAAGPFPRGPCADARRLPRLPLEVVATEDGGLPRVSEARASHTALSTPRSRGQELL